MTTFLNYTLPYNLTDFPGAIDYGGAVINTGLGVPPTSSPVLGLLMLVATFIGFYALASKYSVERALSYSLFMSALASFIMVSGNILDPIYLVLTVILLAGVIFFWGDR